MEKSHLRILLCVFAVSHLLQFGYGCQPPSVADPGPQQLLDTYFNRYGFETTVQCRAGGSGSLQFTWYVNEEPLSPLNGTEAQVLQVAGGQDLRLTEDSLRRQRRNLFHIRCKVTNDCGTSFSPVSTFRRAFLNRFHTTEPTTIRVPAGTEHVTLTCTPPDSAPAPRVRWYTLPQDGYDVRRGPQALPANNRFIVDEMGDLHIFNIQSEDDDAYACSAENSLLRVIQIGPNYILRVSSGRTAVAAHPVIVYRSPMVLKAVVGGSVSMQCVFAGSPIPEVWWRRENYGGDLDPDRTTFTQSEMVIVDVRESDQGGYLCEGMNGERWNQFQHFWLLVEAKPTWVSEPHDQVVHPGNSVTFLCEGDGVPAPTVQWFINGNPVADDSPVLASPTNLTFPHVGPDDSRVIQCNVSNTVGYIWTDVSMQVLDEETSNSVLTNEIV